MVSILVTMILMIIISLITIGFARLVRREQRQSLDTQLSTQAFYAAEAGINDAVDALQNHGYNSEKDECEPETSGQLSSYDNVLDSGVEYTCLLIDPSPTSLEYRSIDKDKSTTIPIKAKSGTIHELTLSWQDTSGDGNINCSYPLGSFPPLGSWPADCNAGMLRIDLVPVGGSVDRDSLLDNTLTSFLQPIPSGSGSLISNLPANKGGYVDANCNTANTPKLCKVEIKTLGPLASDMYLRVRSIYKANSLNIVAKDASGTQLELVGSQAIVDSTGKANDVLRRIVVRVPIGDLSKGDVPDFAIQSSDTICKRMAVVPNIAPTFPAPTNSACQIN